MFDRILNNAGAPILKYFGEILAGSSQFMYEKEFRNLKTSLALVGLIRKESVGVYLNNCQTT